QPKFCTQSTIMKLIRSLISCQQKKQETADIIDSSFTAAEEQYKLLSAAGDRIQAFPRTLDKDGNVMGTDEWDWTGGFFPGALWYIYEHTQNEKVKTDAIKWTEALEAAKDLDQHHDIGFVMYCPYGNAIRFLDD